MGFFDMFRRRPHNPPKPTGPVITAPPDYYAAISFLNQTSYYIYEAPRFSVSGQPQSWTWQPEEFVNAQPGTWQANWNAMYPVFRPFYGMALRGGVDKALLRQIYEVKENHSAEEGATLVNVMHENGLTIRIENGQLVAVRMNSNGTSSRMLLTNLAWPDAPSSVRQL
jgi:hypothetical protein